MQDANGRNIAALNKQGINIPFGQGLDLKTDPNQVQMGKFLALSNAQFDNGGQLRKRNGFPLLTTLPNSEQTTLTTLNDSLLATGSNLYAYSPETNQWLNQGLVTPVDVKAQAIVRSSTNQTQPDAAVSSNGLVCTVYLDNAVPYYIISELSTGTAIVQRTALPATATSARVNCLGRYFVITFIATVAATPHLQYIAIPIVNPSSPTAATDISTAVSGLTAGYDAHTANNNLYVAWNGNDGGGAIRVAYLSSTLSLSSTKIITGHTSNLMSIAADTSGSTAVIWVTFWESSGNDGYTTALSQTLVTILAPTQVIAGIVLSEITSVATAMTLYFFYQTVNNYSYASIRSDFVSKKTVTQAGVVSSATVVLRSVGLASKAFYNNMGTACMLVVYGGASQPTYFLIDLNGNILAKVAYANGGGYYATQVLPSVSINEDTINIAYLFKDFLVSVSKDIGTADSSNIYTQTGVNLASFEINLSSQNSAEIAQTLQLTGGIGWMYDSIKPVELGFQVWPENLTVTTSGTGGLITAQQYFYVFCYEWTDSQGNLHRSAPSIPVSITTTGATSTNTINVPYLRLTYKGSSNPVRLVGYRWSTAQQVFYQFTSISSPTINNTAADSAVVTDALADSSILGNTILYTTGGVIENIAPPASTVSTLYRNRYIIVDAEDRNLLWYSKQVIENTPVEMSDLLTIYVAPTVGAQFATGPITALSAMDDKLIIFKKNAIYYITGNGPDNTGANNDFSDPVFITSTAGCDNPRSIVFMPKGIMFQSDKGIWLLGRDLSTSYIGADVENFNATLVKGALSVPGTNQVRFTLENGTVLMYDYYYQQWCTFNNIPGISSTLYNNLHTYLNSEGQVLQQSLTEFKDNGKPVLMSFSTAWIKLTNLQGFQRAYFFYILSNYLTPHKLSVNISYDYSSTQQQSVVITPTNFNLAWGEDQLWGSTGPWGGNDSVEQWRVFLNKQKCQAIQVSMSEIYDPSKDVPAGAGLTMSGLNFVIGAKAGYPKLPASQSTG